MDRDIHDGLRGRDLPVNETANDAGSCAPAVSRKARRQNTEDYTVIIDLPDPLPVTDAELELLESELAEFIAELLKK